MMICSPSQRCVEVAPGEQFVCSYGCLVRLQDNSGVSRHLHSNLSPGENVLTLICISASEDDLESDQKQSEALSKVCEACEQLKLLEQRLKQADFIRLKLDLTFGQIDVRHEDQKRIWRSWMRVFNCIGDEPFFFLDEAYLGSISLKMAFNAIAIELHWTWKLISHLVDVVKGIIEFVEEEKNQQEVLESDISRIRVDLINVLPTMGVLNHTGVSLIPPLVAWFNPKFVIASNMAGCSICFMGFVGLGTILHFILTFDMIASVMGAALAWRQADLGYLISQVNMTGWQSSRHHDSDVLDDLRYYTVTGIARNSQIFSQVFCYICFGPSWYTAFTGRWQRRHANFGAVHQPHSLSLRVI